MRLNFDAYVAIDWSGAKSIKTKSIAVGCANQGIRPPCLIKPEDGELWSRTSVANWIIKLASKPMRTLIGIDCNFGYAMSVLQRQIPGATNAFQLWSLVDEICSSASNFYAEPFWTHPVYRDAFWIEGSKPANFQMPRRLTETVCGEVGNGWPESPFKMIGPKQVGKGGLAGMRMINDLRKKLYKSIAFWPFDSVEMCNNAQIIIAEIYPRLFIRHVGMGAAKLRNASSLNQAFKKLNSNVLKNIIVSDHETDALVAAAGLRHFAEKYKNIADIQSLSDMYRLTLQCEGWIFGVPIPVPFI